MTGTVEAQLIDNLVTLTIRLTPADFIDVASGLAAVDVLGGFQAWRTVLPVGDLPARYAGQFTLRRYEPPTTQETAAPAGSPEAGMAQAREPKGCRGCGERRDAELQGATTSREQAAAAVLEAAPLAEPPSDGPAVGAGEITTCGATASSGMEYPWSCTLPRGHVGHHEASTGYSIGHRWATNASDTDVIEPKKCCGAPQNHPWFQWCITRFVLPTLGSDRT